MLRRPGKLGAPALAALLSAFALAAMLPTAHAAGAPSREDCERQFQPQTGQPGKDVIWVPTNDRLVTRMLQLAAVTPRDLVYDLGAGDGKIAIAAAKEFGARAVGVEYEPHMAKLAQCYAQAAGVSDRVHIIQGDIFETDFSEASVVTLYLLPELNMRLRPKLLKMQPGTRVVSHSFLMDDWDPDDRSMTEDGQAYLWIVPAQVGGTWVFQQENGRDRFTIQLDQQFQKISGNAQRQPLSEARLNGRQIELKFAERGHATRVAGRVEGNRIHAQVTRGNSTSKYVGTRS